MIYKINSKDQGFTKVTREDGIIEVMSVNKIQRLKADGALFVPKGEEIIDVTPEVEEVETEEVIEESTDEDLSKLGRDALVEIAIRLNPDLDTKGLTKRALIKIIEESK